MSALHERNKAARWQAITYLFENKNNKRVEKHAFNAMKSNTLYGIDKR